MTDENRSLPSAPADYDIAATQGTTADELAAARVLARCVRAYIGIAGELPWPGDGWAKVMEQRELLLNAIRCGTPDTSIREAEVQRILHEVRDRYARFSRGDADIFRVLENRLIPLAPGEPVQFLPVLRQGDVDPGKRRWFNGTYDGPVDNPDDPNRSGDVVVLSNSGRHVSVFLSSVRRRA